ncbi:MAG TPA: PGF-pre-PGF domain-containing protein, partial [archaeon]|nr:PGF-pre-PGF domain-containing protein [archaeon]
MTICHRPEQIPPQTDRGDYEQLGNPQTICVAPDALQTHHEHGDYLGECVQPDEKERDREIRNIIERLEARRPKEIPILRPDMPLEKVTIEVDEEFTRVELIFRNTERPPQDVPAPERKVRRYIEIEHPDIRNEKVTSAKLDFKVERSWLQEQGASLGDVVLTRFKDGAWQDLPTRNVRSDANYEYFEADSAGLSVFAITVRAQEPTAEPAQEIPVQPPVSLLSLTSQTSLIGIAAFVLAGGALGAMLLSRMQRRAPGKAASPALAQYVQSCRE